MEASAELKTANAKVVARHCGGICLLGIALTSRFAEDIRLLNLCMGGFSGTELVKLPYEGGVSDQPARLLKVYEIVRKEIDDYASSQESHTGTDDAHSKSISNRPKSR